MALESLLHGRFTTASDVYVYIHAIFFSKARSTLGKFVRAKRKRQKFAMRLTSEKVRHEKI